MQILELDIGRFGVWNNIAFPFQERGVTVLYGPNEAGKSTLMRLIRGMLYGFPPGDEKAAGPHFLGRELSSTMRLTHRGQEYRLSRFSEPHSRGRLELDGRAIRQDDPLFKSFLGETPEVLFENIFAIGLHELQQLATLNEEEVARSLYSLSLGPEGEQIFAALSGLSREEQRLVGKETVGGDLKAQLDRLREVDRELARLGPQTEKYHRLQSGIRELESQVADSRRRQSSLQQELRGRQFLVRVRDPWLKERMLQQQIDQLPADDLDQEILDRFDELEIELSEIDETRKTLIEEARQLQQQAEAIQTRPELEQHVCAVQQLFEQTRAMQSLERNLSAAPSSALSRDRELQEFLVKLDGHWDERRLQDTDVSAATIHQLYLHAAAYRQAGQLRHRTIQNYKKLSQRLKRLQQDAKGLSRQFGTQPPAELRVVLQRRIQELEELRGLRLRRDQLKKTLPLLNRGVGPRVVARELPPFFWLIVWFLVIAGGIVCIAGAYTAIKTAWIVGGCYMLLGIATMCISWTMKKYFESIDFQVIDSGEERRSLETELQRIEQSIDRILRREPASTSAARFPTVMPVSASTSEDEQIQLLRRRLQELDHHEPLAQRIDALRKRLSGMRQTLQERQRQLGNTRRDWTTALRKIGLTETLKIGSAFEQCQALAEAQKRIAERASRFEREEQQRRELEAFYQQVDELATRIEGPQFRSRDRYQLLADWDREVQQLAQRRQERAQLRQSAKEKRREAGRVVEKIEKMRRQRSALLERLGVADRGEIALKLAAIDERKTLIHQRNTVREELQKLCATEPELALVESDLLEYDERTNRESLTTLKRQIEDLEAQILLDAETLGALKGELREIEDDRTVTSLRFDREQILHGLRDRAGQWSAVRLAERLVNQLRQRIEKERQPRLLAAASHALHRLTCGKYHNIWTPLGEKTLIIDDDAGRSLRVEQLSSGTREQVFLAVRLAMIRDFARQGVELPLVLDDVTVNFDQPRTEAAVQTLLDIAEEGQQIVLFTCHLHLAQMFEAQGVEPVWLPSRQSAQLQH